MEYNSQNKKCKLLKYANRCSVLLIVKKFKLAVCYYSFYLSHWQRFKILLMPTVNDEVRDKHCHIKLRGALLDYMIIFWRKISKIWKGHQPRNSTSRSLSERNFLSLRFMHKNIHCSVSYTGKTFGKT